jgi:hypothetical protein
MGLMRQRFVLRCAAAPTCGVYLRLHGRRALHPEVLQAVAA